MVDQAACTPVAPGAVLLPGLLTPLAGALAAVLRPLLWQAPLRHLRTPGGGRMAVATSNAGALGWLSDARGYRYASQDPLSGRPWPPLPALLDAIARAAAARAGFPGFAPDAVLVNLYRPGVGLGLHQDRDERDAAWPIVSASLGLPARFRLGGLRRDAPTQELVLQHGDLLVFGGPARRCFHGVRPLAAGHHPWAGEHRLNLTFRRAG
ncbi:alpha-ketoglutarate-dependent dioxygenase AlkB [Piscinibacter sakaiensis]|uniref:alpha-ketoglutarate-dependent dioxygenase AlkB n=1 Tax=Piscinibacter sakaiensis TaxID=1547922 RepID=UPI0006B3FC3F|nr:alpha-ketoglutarate-dependent dioxygenase AlkB [Piscinibacter sakaiensis]